MMDALAHNAPMIALIGFLIGFLGIAFWAYAPKNKAAIEKNAEIPFKE